jgi:hypothetical protein
MSWPTVFASLSGGNEPLSLIDGMFAQVAAMIPIPCTATGTNTITLAPIGNAPSATNLSAYGSLNLFSFIAVSTSTSTVAVQFGSLASLPVYKSDGTTQATTGDIIGGRPYMLMYSQALNGGGGGFYLLRLTVTPSGGQPTYTTLNSGTGTYTTPANCTQLFVRMCGGGGGGGSAIGGQGSSGTQSAFGSTTALGGTGGFGSGSAGPGGTGGTTATGTEILRLHGGTGQEGATVSGGTVAASSFGGVNPYGGGGASAAANTGSGGRSDGTATGGSTLPGGAGAGEYVEFVIASPSATYAYQVGAGGAASGGTSQAGASGVIQVTERYG